MRAYAQTKDAIDRAKTEGEAPRGPLAARVWQAKLARMAPEPTS